MNTFSFFSRYALCMMPLFIFNLCLLSPAIAHIQTDVTYSQKNTLGRFYFANNQIFTQQLGENWGSYKAGYIFHGRWRNATDGKLCLVYEGSADEFCYTVLIDNLITYLLDANDNIAFSLIYPQEGNWLFSEDGFKNIYAIMHETSYQITHNYDLKMTNLLANKVYEDDLRFITLMQDGSGSLKLKSNQTLDIPFQWEFKGGILRFSGQGFGDQIIITDGTEFLEQKNAIYYIYERLDHVINSSGGFFAVKQTN